jgi:hypothetical protein
VGSAKSLQKYDSLSLLSMLMCFIVCAAAGSRYSSLSCDPQDWALEVDRPCSGEKLLLMFDRWQKLAKSFFKKGRFDISKVRLGGGRGVAGGGPGCLDLQVMA